MKNKLLSSITVIVLVLIITTLLNWSVNRVDPRDIIICQVAFVVIDSETGKKINVSVAPNNISISNIGGSKIPPSHMEMDVNGPYRFTWADVAPTTAVIELSASGYDSVIIDPLLYSIQSGSLMGGYLKTHEIKMTATQQYNSNDGAGQAGTVDQ